MTVEADQPASDWTAGFKEIGWFSIIYIALAGAPSAISLAHSAFALGDARTGLSWITESYERLAQTLTSIVEPLLARIGAGAATLHPHWVWIFFLVFVYVIGWARIEFRDKRWASFFLVSIVGTLISLAGALVAGLFELNGAWLAQGVIAVAPAFGLLVLAPFLVRKISRAEAGLGLRDNNRWLVSIGSAAFFAPIFLVAAALSFAPVIGAYAGVIVLMALLIANSAFEVAYGVRNGHPSYIAQGFTVLGGYLLAAIVMAVSFAFA